MNGMNSNNGHHSTNNTASHLRNPEPLVTALWEPQILHDRRDMSHTFAALSYSSIANTHLHRPSAALEALATILAWKSLLGRYSLLTVFIMAGGILSLSKSFRSCRKFISPRTLLLGPQYSFIWKSKQYNHHQTSQSDQQLISCRPSHCLNHLTPNDH